MAKSLPAPPFFYVGKGIPRDLPRRIKGYGGGKLGNAHDPFLVNCSADGTVDIPALKILNGLTPNRISDRNRLLKQLDDLAAKHPDARLGCCTILLKDGGFRRVLGEEIGATPEEQRDFSKKLAAAAKRKDDLEKQLKALAQAKMLEHVNFGLDATSGPKNYKIAEDAAVTVLFYNRHQILANYSFKEALKEADVNKIAARVRATVLEVEKRSRPTRR